MKLVAALLALLLASPAWANPLDANPGAQQGSGNALPGGTVAGAAQYRASATTLAGDDATIIGGGLVTTGDLVTRCDPSASTCLSQYPSNTGGHITPPTGTDCGVYFVDQRPWFRCSSSDTLSRRYVSTVLSTNCAGETAGRNGDVCFQDNGAVFRCLPASGLCDTAAEWLDTTSCASIVSFFVNPGEGAGATEFFALQGGTPNATETNVDTFTVPADVQISRLSATIDVAPDNGSSQTKAITVDSAGSATAVTCTLGGTTTCSDTTHKVVVPSGSKLDIKSVNTGTPATAGELIVSLCLGAGQVVVTTTTSTSTSSTSSSSTTSSTTTASTTTTSTAPTELQMFGTVGWSMSTSAGTKYGSYGNDGFSAANKGQAAISIPVGGTLASLYCAVTAAPGAGNSWTFTVAAGSTPGGLADTTQTCAISGASAVSCNDTTHTTSVSAGDDMNFKVDAAGTPTAGVTARCSVQLQ